MEGEGTHPPVDELVLGFFDSGHKWVERAQELHQGMGNALMSVCRALNINDPDLIIEEISRRPRPKVSADRNNHIGQLEKEREGLQIQITGLEAELNVARQKESEALHLVRNLTQLVASPTNVLIRSEMFNHQLIKDGHITESKVLTILVDFQAKMEVVLKEMCKLLGHLDPDKVLDIQNISECKRYFPHPHQGHLLGPHSYSIGRVEVSLKG